MNEEQPSKNDRCREMLAQIYLFIDREGLPEQRRNEIRQHLESCPPCGGEHAVEERFVQLIADVGCTNCPDDLRLRITSLLQEF
jgi:mycothiol system anti-sigma-R factor